MKRIPLHSIWRVFVKHYNLNDQQIEQFHRYMAELKSWNERINLTAIEDGQDVIDLHFDDSLQSSNFIDFSKVKTTCDVGTGGGFPGIPLKILFPHLSIYLIEINRKKIEFLEHLVDVLQLDNVTIIPLDWRTFLRKTDYDIELFCSRASLDPIELIRMFKPSCHYKDRSLIYWASRNWEPAKKVSRFCSNEWEYHVEGRKRRLIKLQNPLVQER
jgi:16S rRNA (guanine527-N7)-methyltransferase